MGEPEGCQPGDCLIGLLRFEPLSAEVLYGMERQPYCLCNLFWFISDNPVKIVAEEFGDQAGFDRADAFHLRVVGQVIGKTVGIQIEVVFHGIDCELPAEFGMGYPAAV